MKEQSIVIVKDASYSLEIKNYKLEHTSGIELVDGGKFIVLVCNCMLPAEQGVSRIERNDTIIQSKETNRIYFTQERFLSEIPKETIRIGDNFYDKNEVENALKNVKSLKDN